MKKILSLTMALCMIMGTSVFATNDNIDDKIENLWLDSSANSAVIDNIIEENNKKMQDDIDLYLITPETYRQKIGISGDDEKMKEQVEKIMKSILIIF